MSIVPIVELAAVGLALWAGWKSLPRPVARDGERLLKATLATLLRGEVEAAGGGLQDWRDKVLGTVLFHPAGRHPEVKLLAPSLETIETPALEGERALVEALAALPTPEARFTAMYVEATAVEEALLVDPAAYGVDYDLGRALNPELGWDDVAAWGEKLREVLKRRCQHLVVGLVGELELPLATELGGVPAVRAAAEGSEEELAKALLAACPRPEQRLVLVARGSAAAPMLRSIPASVPLRDRVAAVILVEPQWTEADRTWLDENFHHDVFEPEVVRPIPYATLLDAPLGEPEAWSAWTTQRLPVPPLPRSGRAVIEVVDFGPLVLDGLSPLHLSRALALWLTLTIT